MSSVVSRRQMQKNKDLPRAARPQSTPPHSEYINSWSAASSQATSTQPRNNHHRHSTSSYASILPQPMYHPLQHKRGSSSRTQATGTTMRRVSSPDIKANSLRHYPGSQQDRNVDRVGSEYRKQGRVIVRRGSFQGTIGRDRGCRDEHHRNSQIKESGYTVSHRASENHPYTHRNMGTSIEDASLKQQQQQQHKRNNMSTGSMHYKHETLDVGEGSQGSQASSQMTAVKSASIGDGRSVSQASWEEGAGKESPFQQTSHVIAMGTTRVPLRNRGEAWQLEEDEDELGGREEGGVGRPQILQGSRPSGHVDEALFTTRIPRHYFHSSGTPSHPHTGTPSQSSQSSSQIYQPGGHEGLNSFVGGHTSDKKHPPNSGTRKILTSKQQLVADWIQEQANARGVSAPTERDASHVTGHVTQSLPRSLRRSETLGSNNRRQHPTRTFSYIQAQVHPVDTQDGPPTKGFDVQQMMPEHRRSTSVSSDGEMRSSIGSMKCTRDSTSPSPSYSSSEVATQQRQERPKSSPHPHRARTKSSPNPVLRQNIVKKVRSRREGEGEGGGEAGNTGRLSVDAIHPDKRFSTGNIHMIEDNVIIAKSTDRLRSASPADGRGHVTRSHTPYNVREEEMTSSDDTGGQSDSEGILRKNKQRTKSSSGSLMSKIARKLGRISTTKLDPDSHETSPSPSGEGEYGREDLVQSLNVGGGADGHTLQVPTPRMQHKQMKSMSTSHLENSYDGIHYRQTSLTDRYSPDYYDGRPQDDGWYRSQGTPPPGSGTPYGTPYGTPKMSRSSSQARQRSAEPDPELLGGLTVVFRSGSKRNLSGDLNETLLDYVEQGNFEGVEQLLESNAIPELNITSEDDFTLVDLASMLGHHDIAKLLLSRGARDSTRFSRDPFSRFCTIMGLLTETERELDSLRYELVVQNSSGGSSSAVRDMERRLKRYEWRAHLFKRMKANYESADLPDAPTDISLHVSSNRSLTVKFSEPLHNNGAPITRYKIEWCKGSDRFSPIVGEFVLTDLRTNEYIIPDLNKGERYFVRVSAFNMKGFGHPHLATPSSAIPSSWHDLVGSRPRFEGSTDNIHIIAAQLNMSLSNSPPISPPPISGTPSMYRKTNVKKSISKLFGTNIRFQKSLRPGVYISSLVYCDDSRVLVTMDEQLPTIAISDSPATSSIGSDFVWLAKVACTWDHVKGMVEVSDSYTSSPAIHSRNKMLHAILELQTALGIQDLGLLHPVPYQDSHGAVVFVIAQYVKDIRSIQSSSLKWMSLPRLWKKRPQASAGDLQAIPVPDQLILDAQEIIAHHNNSTRPLTRGLYLGYLKARSTVASMKVICSREYPNVLPHHKIRENPNISQEEWEWLKCLSTSLSSYVTPSHPSSSSSRSPSPMPTATVSAPPHSLQRLLPTAVDTFLHNLGIFKEDAERHQLYCHEIIELNEDISILLIIPPSDQVCTPPGSTDHFAKLSDFVALPINTFEIMQLYTYQKAFMAKFSTVSARLDIELLTSQQRFREAFSKAEVTAAKELKEQLESFQERTDSAWKEMRWIEEAVQKGRNQTMSSSSSLLSVKMFRDAVKASGGIRGNLTPEANSGYLRVFPAYTTGLINGTSVRLFITESTTTNEVVRLVVQQLEKARIDKGVPGAPLTEEDFASFYLVARQNGQETVLDYDYAPLKLQTSYPHKKWRLLVRRAQLDERRTNEQMTSV